MKNLLQKVWCKNIHPDPRYTLWHKGHLSGTLPWLWRTFLTPGMDIRNPKWVQYGVKDVKDHLQKVWCQNIHPAPRYSSMSHCDTKCDQRTNEEKFKIGWLIVKKQLVKTSVPNFTKLSEEQPKSTPKVSTRIGREGVIGGPIRLRPWSEPKTGIIWAKYLYNLG